MEGNLLRLLDLHKKWRETMGNEGKQLKLDEVDLRSFDLSTAELVQTQIIACTFDALKLENIDFHYSLLAMSTFKNSHLDKCDFYKTDLRYTDFTNCVIKNTRFSKGDCWEALFRNAHLTDCNLINASFYSSDLRGVRMDNVDISAVTFEETLLTGSTMKNIKGAEAADIKSINIGTREKPIMLKAEEAREWILRNIDS